MKNRTQQEYVLAMETLDELCAAQKIKTNDKLRALFWQGVVHGWNRAGGRSGKRDRREHKPQKLGNSGAVSLRDSQVDSSAGLSDSTSRKRSEDVSKAHVFKL